MGVVVHDSSRDLGLQCDHRQTVAEQVVEIAGDPQTLFGDGEDREILARFS